MLNMYTTRKKTLMLISTLIASLIIAILAVIYFMGMKKTAQSGNAITHEKITLNNSQNLQVFHAQAPEKGLLLYIYDKRQNADKYAIEYAKLSYYVAALDIETLLTNSASTTHDCINLAEKLSSIGKQLQEHYDLDADDLPLLAGNNEGATLVYAALAQAPKNSFHAGISINFNDQLTVPEKNSNGLIFCTRNGFTATTTGSTTTLAPIKHLATSWYIFQDKSFPKNSSTRNFTNQVSNARLTIADGINQTSLSESIQILQWLDPRLSDQISSDNSDSELPLIEVTALGNSTENNLPDTMVVLLTGDGGWAEIDKSVAKIFAEKGIPTIALDSLSYFWKTRTPVDTAKDLDTTINIYREKWHKQKVILIGYSFGADVLPFIANKLSTETQSNISLIALLGMGKTAAFKFRLSSWINADSSENRLPILPELQNMAWANSVCVYGVDDPESNCTATAALGVRVIAMSGDHHFDKKYDELVQHLINSAKHKNTP